MNIIDVHSTCMPVPHRTNTTSKYSWPSGGLVGEQLKMSRMVRVLHRNRSARMGQAHVTEVSGVHEACNASKT